MVTEPVFRTVTGRPLVSAGLDDVLIIPDKGQPYVLQGLAVHNGERIVEAILKQAGPGATVYYDMNRTPYLLELRLH